MKEIINRLKEIYPTISKQTLKEIINNYENILLEEVKETGKVKTKIGVIKVVERKERKGTTPQGKEYSIPGRKVIVYKVSKKVRNV